MMRFRGVVIAGLALTATACGWLESDEAQQAAEATREAAKATRETVERGVEATREQLDRVDLEQARDAWDATVEAVGGGGGGTPEDDPLAMSSDTVVCEELGRSCTVTFEFVQRARSHGARLARQARLRTVDSPVAGVRIEAIDPGTVGDRVGLRAGDVVTQVNGVAVHSLQDTMMLYMQVRAANRFFVVYRRGGEERTLQVDVV